MAEVLLGPAPPGDKVTTLREAVDRPERLAYIHRMFEAYQAFAAGM